MKTPLVLFSPRPVAIPDVPGIVGVAITISICLSAPSLLKYLASVKWCVIPIVSWILTAVLSKFSHREGIFSTSERTRMCVAAVGFYVLMTLLALDRQ